MTTIKKFFILCNLFLVSFALSAKEPSKIPTSSSWRKRVVDAAYSVMQSNKTYGGGKWFNRDCSGTIYAIFAEANSPLSNLIIEYAKPGLNGVAIIYDVCKLNPYGSIVSPKKVQPGDLVFFSNTYDKNQNNKSDDWLTHIGVVTKVEKDSGRIYFIHYNTYYNQIKEEMLNIKYPRDAKENIILRWPSAMDKQKEIYAGELVHDFGRPF